MKQLACEYVWWPQINTEIEQKVKSCNACQVNRNTPELAPLQPWEWPNKPWSQIHVVILRRPFPELNAFPDN